MRRSMWVYLGLVLLLIAAVFYVRRDPASETENVPRLVVYAYSSFPVDEIIDRFEEEHQAELVFVAPGGSSDALSRLITEQETGGSEADVFLGLADTSMSRALAHDIFEPFDPDLLTNLADIPSELLIDETNRLLPFDYGYISLVYHPERLAPLPVPESLEALTRPEYQGKIIAMDASSSTGQAFLMWTIAEYGEDGYLDYWRRLLPNLLTITNSWSTGYQMFENGEAPIIVSYATDRVVAAVYGGEPVHEILLPAGQAYRQMELMGIVKGTDQRELAHAFIDYVLSPEVQALLPTANLMFPVNPKAELPEVFSENVVLPSDPVMLDPDLVDARLDTWLRDWSRVITE